MIKTVLIDDEADARFMLRNLLDRHFSDRINVVGEAEEVDTAIKLIRELSPDLVFLDVRINDQTGFDVLEAFDRHNFEVIFVTAYDEYAVRAFEFSATGYVMKPIKVSALEEAIRSAERKSETDRLAASQKLKVLVEQYGTGGEVRKLVIPHIDGFNIVDLADIIRLEGDRNYTLFVLRNRKPILATKTLGEYESLLGDFSFYRIHQSTVVNLRHVTAYHRSDNSVETVDGARSVLSRMRKAGFIERFL